LRLFVALYPPPEAVDHLTGFVRESLRIGAATAEGVNVRLAPPDNYHLTLAFLGDVAAERLDDVSAALGLVPRTGAPRVRVAGGGRFGRGRFAVLWAGLDGEVDALRALARTVRRELKRARLPYDDKPWKPHLTIARPGDRVDRAALDADRELLAGYAGPAWPASEMTLVRSHLGPRPTYDRLGTWPL
jgi:RNA 2',3'-cyclic 3'-phosphodiesterase